MKIHSLALALLLLLLVPKAHSLTLVVQNESHLKHAHALVRTALEAGGLSAELQDAPKGNERRNLALIRDGHTHIDMMPATPARLELVRQGQLRMIPIPLDRGLLGYRVNLLLATQQDKLARVRKREDLRAFSMGQNVGWMDIEIYRAAGIPTREVKDWANGEFALQMEAGFLDLFPLGLEETLNYFLPHFRRHYPQLTLDPHILVRYPWFRFVWVSPRPEADPVYEALQRGFAQLVADGRFLKIWHTHRQPPPDHVFKRRSLIELDNPFYGYELIPAAYRHLLYHRDQP